MPTPDQSRIESDRARPRIMELWWALRPLTSVIRFMQTGAHPDDEISGMLAALAFRDGINLSYACSTRGEGGQNDVGTEAGAALGALRTREMERACDVLRMRMYWHSETPDDSITDFGFSKSGEETLGRWGQERILARFVEIIRTERPDIICPTFLDVPGQHGHHRAMTQAAHEAMIAAADPAFPSDLAPWQVKKMYLPAWSGAGQAYDDDVPPPPATLTVSGSGGDLISGWSWERIGQQSRAFHRSQGMGRWVPRDQARDWPVHLAQSHVPGPDTELSSGLLARLGDLADLKGADVITPALTDAQAAIDAAISAFPRLEQVSEAATRALKAVRLASDECPDDLKDEILHRLDAKAVQLGHVIRLALGIDVEGRVADAFLIPGQSTSLNMGLSTGRADAVDIAFDLPAGWEASQDSLSIGSTAAPTEPYRPFYDPASADAPACVLSITHDGTETSVRLPLAPTPVVMPQRLACIAPGAALINLTSGARTVGARVDGIHPEGGAVSLDLPDGWTAEVTGDDIKLTVPHAAAPGLYEVPVHVDASPAHSVQRIEHAHTEPTAMAKPAALRVLVLEAHVPDVKIGYVGAGNDRVGHWLGALGADVAELTDSELTNDTALAAYDTIVIGIFAMRFRAGLSQAMPRLHRWVEAGGTLVTLYHRPWDNWDPDQIPPRRLEIGQPSLRWRVTDEGARVRHLADHPILTSPNVIGSADWAGWVKERGLYFAKSWDSAYVPVIEMADPGETPHQGALLVGDLGKGRHVHTSLILHHQMENLVPGAFRLMANLLARRE